MPSLMPIGTSHAPWPWRTVRAAPAARPAGDMSRVTHMYMYGHIRAASRAVSDPRDAAGNTRRAAEGGPHVPAAIQTGNPGRHSTPAGSHRRHGHCRRQRAAAAVVTFDTAVDDGFTRPRDQRLEGRRHADERALGLCPPLRPRLSCVRPRPPAGRDVDSHAVRHSIPTARRGGIASANFVDKVASRTGSPRSTHPRYGAWKRGASNARTA